MNPALLRTLDAVTGSTWTPARVRRALARLAPALRSLDHDIVELDRAQPPTCRGSGCAACCRSDFPVYRSELPALLEALPPAAWQRAAERLPDLVERATRVPCPALDPASQTCTIYDRRPAVCRAHAVTSPPEWCDEDVVGDHVIHQVAPRILRVGRFGVDLGHRPTDHVSWYEALAAAVRTRAGTPPTR
jgi:Fe-S-cluster containining protein